MWDIAIVGGGPAGAAAALGALTANPRLSVLILDRAEFPRDKACGDGIAPHALDLLAELGVTGLVDDLPSVRRLRLTRGSAQVARSMRRPAWVVPRVVFDARLVSAATAAGAVLERRHVRRADVGADGVRLDGDVEARVVIGADGAHSRIRTAAGLPAVRRRAIALRGYAPTRADRRGAQVLVFDTARPSSYAWSFDRGDGMANVGYGELLRAGREPPSRRLLLDRLERLLPGTTAEGDAWRAHHLPLSSWSWTHTEGRLLLAGDAAGLVNPLTGEGIYYAVATGIRAGRAAAASVQQCGGGTAGAGYRRAVHQLLAGHLRHTALASRLARHAPVLHAALCAARDDQEAFDDLVDLGLGRGKITPRVALALARRLPRASRHATSTAGYPA